MKNAHSAQYSRYLKRKKMFAGYGYDVDAEREFILQQSEPHSGEILEAGTGKGHFALALARKGYSFTSFDISAGEQAVAKQILAHFGMDHRVRFRVENGERLSFGRERFDSIFSVNTLHHLMNPYKVIDELLRVLAKGGKLVIADFTREGLALMAKIHAGEGNTHQTGPAGTADAIRYLIGKGFVVDTARTLFQDMLIAQRRAR